MKQLDLSRSVADLVGEFPELSGILADLGFTEITKKAALATVGRIMTIPKGAELKDIPMEKILAALRENGFSVAGEEEAGSAVEDRQALLESYVRRLTEGEDLESVRRDFVENFEHVDAAEIAKAEQALIEKGTPIAEVQKLCDVHSALFHGATRNEQIARAEEAVQASLQKEKPAPLKRQDGGDIRYRELSAVPGHPLQIFKMENDAIDKQLKAMRSAMDSGEGIPEELEKTRALSIHYAKKGDLIYPPLKLNYGFSGPSDVMWGVDDEIRDDLRMLARELAADPAAARSDAWQLKADAVLTRAEEMVYKEENILYPLCAKNFTERDWQDMARDMEDYDFCLIDPVPRWESATAGWKDAVAPEGEIVLPTGHFTAAQLEAMLNTIPLEITFIDDGDINRYFNDNGEPKLFKRPLAALDREVYSCHPPKIEPMVRSILRQFREGTRDSVEVWNVKNGEPVLVRYMAVRDREGTYLGTMECVQPMGFAKEHFEKGGSMPHPMG